MEAPLRTVKALASRLQVTPRSVYQWIRDGKLEAVRVGGRIRVPEDAVQKMMKPARERKGYSE